MSVRLLPIASWAFDFPIFKLDATLSVARDDTYKATKYAIETGEEVADYLIEEPHKFTISGIVSASATVGTQDVYTRLSEVHDALITHAQTRQPVTLVTEEWTEDVLITKVTAKHDTSGDLLSISMTLQSYQIATFQSVEIPAEFLADDVADDATEDPGEGGAGAGEEPEDDDDEFDPNSSSVAAGLADGYSPWSIAGGFF
jgi:hypothetical protein